MKQDSKSANRVLSMAIWFDALSLSGLCGMLLADARWSDLYATWPGVFMLLWTVLVSVIGLTCTIVAIRTRSRA